MARWNGIQRQGQRPCPVNSPFWAGHPGVASRKSCHSECIWLSKPHCELEKSADAYFCWKSCHFHEGTFVGTWRYLREPMKVSSWAVEGIFIKTAIFRVDYVFSGSCCQRYSCRLHPITMAIHHIPSVDWGSGVLVILCLNVFLFKLTQKLQGCSVSVRILGH